MIPRSCAKFVEHSLRQTGIDLSDVLLAGKGAEALSMLKDAPST